MQPITYLGKKIGNITTDNRFIAFRRPEHFFIKYQGFGLSTNIIQQLRKRKVKTTVIVYTKKNAEQSIYETPINTFYEEGIPYTDREADTQRILPIKHMKKRNQKL